MRKYSIRSKSKRQRKSNTNQILEQFLYYTFDNYNAEKLPNDNVSFIK
jgi:hypothetical protein